MKWFSFRSLAISVFIFDTGMSTRRCFDPHALRIRVNMSAIGSVMLMVAPISSRFLADVEESFVAPGPRPSLPTRFPHTGNHPLQGQLPETNAKQPEAAQKGSRPSAP